MKKARLVNVVKINLITPILGILPLTSSGKRQTIIANQIDGQPIAN